jgi:multidrug efflux pump subunit AcrA (membrane-fusion protein)
VDVPESEAALVQHQAPAQVSVRELKGRVFQGKVTRTAKVLDPRTRTLRTEIDLPAEGKLKSGMYAQVAIRVEHSNSWGLPASAIASKDDQTFCYQIKDGKAVRTLLQTGIRDGDSVEILAKAERIPKAGDEATWTDLTGHEEIAVNAGSMTDGQPVGSGARGK